MRRIALISSVLLPLPFAALPLAAVVFSGGPSAPDSDLAITTDAAPPTGVTEAVSFATGPGSPDLPCGDASNIT